MAVKANQIAIIALLTLFVFSVPASAEHLQGLLYTVWPDARSGDQDGRASTFLLTDDQRRYQLNLPSESANAVTAREIGSLRSYNGQRVNVTVSPVHQNAKQVASESAIASVEIQSISVLGAALDSYSGGSHNPIDSSPSEHLSQPNTAPVVGSKRYVSLLCKFNDVAAEPRSISYFDDMYGDASGQLGHYWREVSSEKINLVGSRSYGGANGNSGWFTMPKPRSSYLVGNGADLDLLFEDCVSAADPFVDFSDVDGINLMFNGELGCCAWGGSYGATLDGVTRVFPTTWEPDWGWSTVAVLAHEMGHSFNLPHSNNSDNDNDPYDSPWTVMSFAYGGFTDPVFGLKGVHINAWEKNDLGWIGMSEYYTVPRNGKSRQIKLSYLDRSKATNGAYRMAVFQTPENHYYTVEARKRSGAYEGVVSSTVIIHSVNENRLEPAWIIDKDVPPADFANTEGVMWRVGEKFEDSVRGVTVNVISQDATGFIVELTAQRSVNGGPQAAINLLLLEDEPD